MDLAAQPLTFEAPYGEEYFARYTGRRAESTLAFQDIHELLAQDHLETCLDLGCGAGIWLQALSKFFPEVLGLDLSITGLRKAARSGNGRILQGSAISLPIRATTIDAVTCLSVIEHLDDTGRKLMLGEISRVLKPSGILVIVTPNKESLLHRFVIRDPTHVRLFNERELLGALVGQGFSIEKVGRTSLTDRLGPLGKLVRPEILVKARKRMWTSEDCVRAGFPRVTR